MQDDQQKQPDPAAIWWGSSRSDAPLEPLPPPPAEPWRWSWSPLVGIKYGPIPIGLIVGLPILIGLWAR